MSHGKARTSAKKNVRKHRRRHEDNSGSGYIDIIGHSDKPVVTTNNTPNTNRHSWRGLFEHDIIAHLNSAATSTLGLPALLLLLKIGNIDTSGIEVASAALCVGTAAASLVHSQETA